METKEAAQILKGHTEHQTEMKPKQMEGEAHVNEHALSQIQRPESTMCYRNHTGNLLGFLVEGSTVKTVWIIFI